MLIPPSPVFKDDFQHQQWLQQVRDFLTTTKLETLDFSSIASNGTEELTVTIKGVKSGDTVIATLGVKIATNSTWNDAVRAANLAAGIVVGKLGTAVVHPEELAAAESAQNR